MKESIIQKAIKLAVIHRFNGWMQRVQSWKAKKAYTDKNNNTREHVISLADGGTPDMVGMVPVLITQEMVWKTIGVFVAVETKKDEETVIKWKEQEEKIKNWETISNKTTKNQIRHKEMIQEWGWIYILTHDPQEVRDIIDGIDFPFCKL